MEDRMTSKLVVNTIEADTGISSVSFASSISLSSTSKFFFSDAGIDIGPDTNIDRPATGVLGFNINDTEKARITSVGKVGIGTNDPQARLDVYDTSGLGILSRSASTQATDTNKALKVRNNSSTDTFNVSYRGKGYFAGKVGIGTTNSSTYKLHLQGTASALARFERTDGAFAKVDIKAGTTAGNSYLTFSDSAASEVGEINYEHGDDSLRIAVNSAERLRITSGGQVNIGGDYTQTTRQLGVVSSAEQVATFEYNGADADGSEVRFYHNSSSPADNDTLAFLQFSGKNSADEVTLYSGISAQSSDVTNGTEDGNIIFSTRSNGSFGERLRIKSDGSVRVGDNSSFTANTNADNLVVGTTNSGNNNGISIISHTNSEPRINFASSVDDDAGMIKYAFSSNVLQLYASGSEKLQCNSAGVRISDNALFSNWFHIGKNGGYTSLNSVGHDNSAGSIEGINWHSNTNYGVYRTKANWSNPYAQLRLDWPTGIAMAGGTAYGLSGVRFMCAALPSANNTYDLGTSALRWRDVYCNQGAFNNSDVELKQDIASLTAAEMKAARRLSALFKTYRWKDAVEEKGTDKARTHTGMIAQQIQAAMSAEGLDATKYGLFGTDEWYENDKKEIITLDQLKDNIPDPLDSSKTISPMSTEGYTKVTRYSVRYTELLSFIAAYNDQRFADLESRVAALEGS